MNKQFADENHNLKVALRVVAARLWRNGGLQELAAKALRGEQITVDDTDLDPTTEKGATKWATLTEGQNT